MIKAMPRCKWLRDSRRSRSSSKRSWRRRRSSTPRWTRERMATMINDNYDNYSNEDDCNEHVTMMKSSTWRWRSQLKQKSIAWKRLPRRKPRRWSSTKIESSISWIKFVLPDCAGGRSWSWGASPERRGRGLCHWSQGQGGFMGHVGLFLEYYWGKGKGGFLSRAV